MVSRSDLESSLGLQGILEELCLDTVGLGAATLLPACVDDPPLALCFAVGVGLDTREEARAEVLALEVDISSDWHRHQDYDCTH